MHLAISVLVMIIQGSSVVTEEILSKYFSKQRFRGNRTVLPLPLELVTPHSPLSPAPPLPPFVPTPS